MNLIEDKILIVLCILNSVGVGMIIGLIIAGYC